MPGGTRSELAGGAVRNPRMWAVLADGEEGCVLFAERPTRAEAEEVAVGYAALIRRCFGEPRVAPPVVTDLASRQRFHDAMRALEERGFVQG